MEIKIILFYKNVVQSAKPLLFIFGRTFILAFIKIVVYKKRVTQARSHFNNEFWQSNFENIILSPLVKHLITQEIMKIKLRYFPTINAITNSDCLLCYTI